MQRLWKWTVKSVCVLVCVCACVYLVLLFSHQGVSNACDPINCSPPGSSVQEFPRPKITRVGSHFLLQRIFLTQGWNPWPLGLLHCRQTLYTTEPSEKALCLSNLLTYYPSLPQKYKLQWDKNSGSVHCYNPNQRTVWTHARHSHLSVDWMNKWTTNKQGKAEAEILQNTVTATEQ